MKVSLCVLLGGICNAFYVHSTFAKIDSLKSSPDKTMELRQSLFRSKNRQVSNAASRVLEITRPWSVPNWVLTTSMKMQNFLLPYLHMFDECATADNCLNLVVLWWKAIAGNKWGTRYYDGGVAYDFLPSWTRLIVSFPFCWLYPKLYHHVVAIRTLYLDEILSLETHGSQNVTDKPNIIVFGAGFDTRSVRLSSYGNWYEIDLPAVITQRRAILQRFLKRRGQVKLPKLFEADLNNIDEIQHIMKHIFLNEINPNLISKKSKTIIIVEAVLMYLQPDNISPLLKSCMEIAKLHSSTVSFCFADRFPIDIPKNPTGMPSTNNDLSSTREYEDMVTFMDKLDLELIEWLPKGGRARHMGLARLRM
eukprot:gene7473-15295_t